MREKRRAFCCAAPSYFHALLLKPVKPKPTKIKTMKNCRAGAECKCMQIVMRWRPAILSICSTNVGATAGGSVWLFHGIPCAYVFSLHSPVSAVNGQGSKIHTYGVSSTLMMILMMTLLTRTPSGLHGRRAPLAANGLFK